MSRLPRPFAPSADGRPVPTLVRCLLGVIVVAAIIALPGTSPAQPPKVDDVGGFMRMKLVHSQHVLEGLAVENFDVIARGANALALASQASSWQVLQTEEYALHSAEFRRSCESLEAAARNKNLDGAALAWMEVTMKCIQCHKYVRAADRQRGVERDR